MGVSPAIGISFLFRLYGCLGTGIPVPFMLAKVLGLGVSSFLPILRKESFAIFRYSKCVGRFGCSRLLVSAYNC